MSRFSFLFCFLFDIKDKNKKSFHLSAHGKKKTEYRMVNKTCCHGFTVRFNSDSCNNYIMMCEERGKSLIIFLLRMRSEKHSWKNQPPKIIGGTLTPLLCLFTCICSPLLFCFKTLVSFIQMIKTTILTSPLHVIFFCVT